MEKLKAFYSFLKPKVKAFVKVIQLKYDEKIYTPSVLPLKYLHTYKKINFAGEEMYSLDMDTAQLDKALEGVKKILIAIILISVIAIISPLHRK